MTTLDKKLINLIYAADKNAADLAYVYLQDPSTDQKMVENTFVYLHAHSAFLGADNYAAFQMKMMSSGYYDTYPEKIKFYTATMYSTHSASLIQKMYLTWINNQEESSARADFLDRKIHNKTTIFTPKAFNKTYPFGSKLKKPHEAARFLHDFILKDNYTYACKYLKELQNKHPDKLKLFSAAILQELKDSASFMTRDQENKNVQGVVTFINETINSNIISRADAPPEWIGFLFKQVYPSLAMDICRAKYNERLDNILSLYAADDLKNPQLWKKLNDSIQAPDVVATPLPTI